MNSEEAEEQGIQTATGQPEVLVPAVVLKAEDLKMRIKNEPNPVAVAINSIPMAIQFIEEECSQLHHLGHRKRAERIRKCLATIRISMNTLWNTPK